MQLLVILITNYARGPIVRPVAQVQVSSTSETRPIQCQRDPWVRSGQLALAPSFVPSMKSEYFETALQRASAI